MGLRSLVRRALRRLAVVPLHLVDAAIRRGNLWGMQFYPEKSHQFGLALMRSLMELK